MFSAEQNRQRFFFTFRDNEHAGLSFFKKNYFIKDKKFLFCGDVGRLVYLCTVQQQPELNSQDGGDKYDSNTSLSNLSLLVANSHWHHAGTSFSTTEIKQSKLAIIKPPKTSIWSYNHKIIPFVRKNKKIH